MWEPCGSRLAGDEGTAVPGTGHAGDRRQAGSHNGTLQLDQWRALRTLTGTGWATSTMPEKPSTRKQNICQRSPTEMP
ncbi:hypothetical protein GCM10011247_48390 [Pseudomonas plecoglossicida]|nr:hypothetical protein GCM10011247_48390 [Pseudomonas plecoglossicida]